MALRDQPYLPLYVEDFLTDEKLMECSASETGIYIRIMCVMHKSTEYGVITVTEKHLQASIDYNNFAKNLPESLLCICHAFAMKLIRFLPYTKNEIIEGLSELIAEGVLSVDGNKLYQRRMVKDNSTSVARSVSGSKGGFAKAKSVANHIAKGVAKGVANSVNENEYINVNKDVVKNNNNEQKIEFYPFDEFWNDYDKKVEQKKCRLKWVKISNDDRKKIQEHLPKYKQSTPDIQYRKNPYTFLNNECWNDVIVMEKTNSKPVVPNQKIGIPKGGWYGED